MRKSAFVPNKIPCDLLQQSWAYVQEPVAPLNTLHLRQASNLRAQEDDAANSGEGGCNLNKVVRSISGTGYHAHTWMNISILEEL